MGNFQWMRKRKGMARDKMERYQRGKNAHSKDCRCAYYSSMICKNKTRKKTPRALFVFVFGSSLLPRPTCILTHQATLRPPQ